MERNILIVNIIIETEMEKVKISVIMPVFNSGPYLKSAVWSVLAQDFESFELILVDDGSTDGSGKRCDEFARTDSRVIVLHQKNGGICNARNSALKIAKGEYVAFADHDDLYKPELLTTIYNCAIEHDVDFVKFSKEYQIVNDDTVQRMVYNVIPSRIIRRDAYKKEVRDLITNWALDCVWDGLYRLDIIKTNDLFFDERFKRGGEDIAFNIKYLCFSKKMETISSIFYTHFVRQGFSTSSKYHYETIDDQIRLTSVVYESLISLHFDFSENRDWYAFYLMRNYFSIIASILANPKCLKNIEEKNEVLQKSLIHSFIPDDLFKVKSLSIFRYSKKIGLAYFFMKHKLYSLLYLMFILRRRMPSLNIT